MYYFQTIAEERQITAAAKKLHMAQPPLSYQLNLLEEELGVTLVKRGARMIELTEAGKLLHKRATEILNLVESAKREVENCGKGLSGVLSIGTISSTGGLIPKLNMLEFTKRYPEVQFEIHEGNTFAIIEMLEKGVIDLGIVRTPFQENMFECRHGRNEPMVAVMSEYHQCGEYKDIISVNELQNKPLIIYRRLESLIQEVFDEIQGDLFIRCKNDDVRTTLSWAKSNLGIAIVPKSALNSWEEGQLICKEIKHERMESQIAVVWLRNQYLSPLAEKFVAYFEEQWEWKDGNKWEER